MDTKAWIVYGVVSSNDNPKAEVLVSQVAEELGWTTIEVFAAAMRASKAGWLTFTPTVPREAKLKIA